jgi:hypothetical protein
VWLIVLSDQLPIVALVSSYPTNQLIGHRPIPQRLATLLSRLHPRKPMRSCRRFLAGIPHCGVGHPCVTHPSATPSGSVKPQGVRLACVRHAASVYPEPGSNSPSVFYRPTPHAPGAPRVGNAHRYLSCDPGQAVFVCTWLFADLRSPSGYRGGTSLTGTAVCAFASTQLLFCFPLFNCQGTTRSKSCSLLCHLLKTDIGPQEQLRFIKDRRSWDQFSKEKPFRRFA